MAMEDVEDTAAVAGMLGDTIGERMFRAWEAEADLPLLASPDQSEEQEDWELGSNFRRLVYRTEDGRPVVVTVQVGRAVR